MSGSWETYFLDMDGDVGEFTSIALDHADGAHISYYDKSHGDLKYANMDSIKPIAVCRDITISLDSSGRANIVAADVDNGSPDNYGIASMIVSPNAFTCSNLGDNFMTLNVIDKNGNSDTCRATVTVLDTTPPEAKCKNISVTLGLSGSVRITPEEIDNGSSDNCGIASMSLSRNTFNKPGNYNVALTVTDTSGNKSQCRSNVRVREQTSSQLSTEDYSYTFGFNSLFGQFGFNSLDTKDTKSFTLMPSKFNIFGGRFNAFVEGYNTFSPSAFNTFSSGSNNFETRLNTFGTRFNALTLPSFNTFPGTFGFTSYNTYWPF